MAKTDDDDDEGFGDFTFAPFAFNPIPFSHLTPDATNGSKSVICADNDDGDEWGDFVEFRAGSNGTTCSFHAPAVPNSFDPFGFASYHSVKPCQSAEAPVELEPTRDHGFGANDAGRISQAQVQWVKPKGALPLSLFGDVEDEEQSSASDPPLGYDNGAFGGGGGVFGSGNGVFGGGNTVFGGGNGVSNSRAGSDVSTSVGFGTIIANLYNHTNESQKSNEESSSNTIYGASTLNSTNSASDTNSFDMKSDTTLARRDSDMAYLHNNGSNLHSDGVDSDMKKSGSNLTGLSLDLTELNSNSGNLHSNSDKLISNFIGQPILYFNDFPSSKTQNINSVEKDWTMPGLNLDSCEMIGSNGLNVNLEAPGFSFGGSNFNSYVLNTTINTENGHLCALVPESTETNPNLQSVACDKADENDNDNDVWEFKDAYSNTKVEDMSYKENGILQAHGFEVHWTTRLEMQVDKNGHTSGSIDIFAPPNEVASKSSESNFEFDAKSMLSQTIPISNSRVNNELKDAEEMTNLHADDRLADFDDSFGDFESASSKSELKPEVNTVQLESHKGGAVSPSIFGYEDLEADGSLILQDISVFRPSSSPQNFCSQGSTTAINDLIYNLYDQVDQNSHSSFAQKPTENAFDTVDFASESNFISDDYDFDDGPWEFEDAISETKVGTQISSLSNVQASKETFVTLKSNNFVEYYSRLKNELRYVIIYHLDDLKKAQSNFSPSGEDTNVVALDEEIQKLCAELQLEKFSLDEGQLDCPLRDICLNEFIEDLQGERLQFLESDYNLSRSLELAGKDFRSAVNLIKHTTTMLRILNLGSEEEQSQFVSTWFKIISVCAQELKHGAWIWKQATEKNIQSQMISEPQGQSFIRALGEIYRVAVILGASFKLYKPWILSSSVESASISVLQEECHAHWSTLGLEEILSSVPVPKDSEYDMFVTLLESLKFINGLDAVTLQNLVFNGQSSLCQISVLTEEVVPGVKMIVWNNQHYFLTLANMWANLISCEPPNLPRLRVGSQG